MNQGLDLRRLILLLLYRFRVVAAAVLLGALLGAGTYRLVTSVTNGYPEYRATSDYYISFNLDEHGNAVDYYNAYTWDNILRDDPIVDYALTLLPESVTKEQVEAAVTGEMLGDYRILTVKVTTRDAGLTTQIAESYHESLVHFGEIIDMLDHIEVWDRGETVELVKNTKTGNAAFLGALLGGLVGLFGLLFYYVLEDAVYVEMDASCRFGLPVYGMLTEKEDSSYLKLYQNNLLYAIKDRKAETWNVEYLPEKEDFERLRQAEALLLIIPWGRRNGAQTRRLLELMEIQDCKVDGFLILGARDRFVRAYYGRKKKPWEPKDYKFEMIDKKDGIR